MKTLLKILFVLVLAWIVWPYYAAYDFVTGLRDANPVSIERRVNWPSLRQGLKDDLSAQILDKMKADESNAAGAMGAGLAAMFGPTLINNVIDTVVTPQGLANLIREGRPMPQQPGALDQSENSRSSTRRVDLSSVRWAFFSGGPTTFLVEIENQKEIGSTLKLIFRWDGDWRLARWPAAGFSDTRLS